MRDKDIFYNHLYVEGDQCKTAVIKDEETIVLKVDEKQCNNPLAGLANAVNAITNGVVGDESQIIPISATVIVNNKQAPPKAMVKPQVLTHVIEGFVIQEGSCIFTYQLYYIKLLSHSNIRHEHEFSYLYCSVRTVRCESGNYQYP